MRKGVKYVRIRTLIVKGVITAACLFVPSEVFANDHAGQGKPEDPPAEEQASSEKGEEVSTEAKANDVTRSKKSDINQPNENANPVAGDKRPDQARQSQPTEQKDSTSNKPKTGPSNKSDTPHDAPKANKGGDQRKVKVGTDSKGSKIHKARDNNLAKSKPSTPVPVQETNEGTAKVKPQPVIKQVEEKATEKDQPIKKDHSQPLPTNQPGKDAPVVIPSNPTTHLSKTTGNGDGHSTNSGNSFTLYGLLLQRDGPLVTLEGDFLMEYRRAHNQWTNAPPSPPPKSNLLSQNV